MECLGTSVVDSDRTRNNVTSSARAIWASLNHASIGEFQEHLFFRGTLSVHCQVETC